MSVFIREFEVELNVEAPSQGDEHPAYNIAQPQECETFTYVPFQVPVTTLAWGTSNLS